MILIMLESRLKETPDGRGIELPPERGNTRYATLDSNDNLVLHTKIRGTGGAEIMVHYYKLDGFYVDSWFGTNKFGPETEEYRAFEELSSKRC